MSDRFLFKIMLSKKSCIHFIVLRFILSCTIMKKAFLKIAFLNYTKLLDETSVPDPLNLVVLLEISMAMINNKCIAVSKTRVLKCLDIMLVARTAKLHGRY